MTRMLGIDPGLTATGWGIVIREGTRLIHADHGVIKTSPRQSDPQRLKAIYDGLRQVIEQFQPDEAAIEDIFMKDNARSALRLGLARGAAILAVAQSQLQLAEIAARAVKQAVTGKGGADKNQVAFMVGQLLGIELKAGDASDALGIAIAGLNGGGVALQASVASTQQQTPHQYQANPALAAAIEQALAKEQEQKK